MNNYDRDLELEELENAWDFGELDLAETICKLVKRHRNHLLDDANESVDSHLIGAMWNLQRASQVNDWSGIENVLYETTCDALLLKIGIKFDRKTGEFKRL